MQPGLSYIKVATDTFLATYLRSMAGQEVKSDPLDDQIPHKILFAEHIAANNQPQHLEAVVRQSCCYIY